MKKKSIKTKLLILLCISISMSFLILGLYNANSAYNSDYKLIKHQEIALSKDISRYLDGYFQAKFDILEASAASVANYEFTIDNQKIVHDLFLAKNSGNFALLFLGFEKNGHEIKSDGKYLTKERNNFDARKRPWYKLAVKLGKSGITKPYISRSSGKLVVSLFTPIKQNGKIIGVLGSDIYMTTVVNVLSNAKLKGLKSTYIVNKKGEILVHKNKKKINKIDETFLQTVIKDKIFFTDKKIDSKEILFAYKNIPSINWYVGLKVDKEVIIDDIKKSLSNQIFLYLVLLVVILAVILYFLNNILSSLKNFEEGLYKFFQYLKGEVTEISKLDIKDNNEFGQMAQVINRQIELVSKNMEEDKVLIDEVNQIVHKIKNGHIDHFIKNKTKNPALEELKNSLNEMIQIIQTNINHDTNSLIETINQYARFNFKANVKNPSGKVAQGLNGLCEIITQMLCKNKTNGEALSSNSNRLLQNVHTLNETTTNTAVSLEETASAIEEINSTVASNTEKINIIKVQSDDLLDAINNGQVLANKTAHAMDDINQQSNSIQEAISVIDQIAFQTNILSLNAAVEAATAGEAGKGFAVVAQEVRNLASRSAEAAKEIKELVEAGTDKTGMGKEIAGHMIDDYKNLNTNILNTANLINEITQAFNEQKISIEQISEVVNKLDSQTQNNAHIASLSNDIAEETSHIAQNILEDVSSKEFNS